MTTISIISIGVFIILFVAAIALLLFVLTRIWSASWWTWLFGMAGGIKPSMIIVCIGFVALLTIGYVLGLFTDINF